MFCLDPVHPLFDAIVRHVGKEPGISVNDLHKRLKKEKIDVTLQHLYRTVNRLIEEQMLLKEKSTLSLNLMWLSYIEFFAAGAKESLMTGAGSSMFPLKPGQRMSFDVDTFLDVQTMWNHLLIQLHKAAPQKYLFKYYSHAWWIWSKQKLDEAFYRRIKEKGIRCFWLYGNNTFLDREAAGMHSDLFDSRIAEDSAFPAEGYNLNVYGEYIVECVFPENIARHLGLLFKTIDSTDKKSLELLSDVFTLKGKYTVTVWRNAAQAKALQQKIGKNFLLGPESYRV